MILRAALLSLFFLLPLALERAVAAGPAPTGKGVELLMVEEEGCVWCARWNKEIAPIYPKTEEARRAPLRRHDKNDPLPANVALARGLFFTPTFVLLVDGVEKGRMEGYPGEDFFWGLLAQMLSSVDKKDIKAHQQPNNDTRKQ